jgi:hypothetical protein
MANPARELTCRHGRYYKSCPVCKNAYNDHRDAARWSSHWPVGMHDTLAEDPKKPLRNVAKPLPLDE